MWEKKEFLSRNSEPEVNATRVHEGIRWAAVHHFSFSPRFMGPED